MADEKKTTAKKAPAKKAAAKKSDATVTVTQTGSPIGRKGYQRGTLIGLGLNKIGRTKTLEDTPSCLLYTSPSPRDKRQSRMPSSA